jgi:hypothetical protein
MEGKGRGRGRRGKEIIICPPSEGCKEPLVIIIITYVVAFLNQYGVCTYISMTDIMFMEIFDSFQYI